MRDRRSRFAAVVGVIGLAGALAVTDRGATQGPRAGTASAAAAPAWAAQVEAGADHLPAAELARRLIEAPDSVLVVDVRPADEFAAFHLPGSVNLDLVRLLGPEGERLLDATGDRTIVLVSNGMTHPAQAWVELARRGRVDVRMLEDGLDGFRARYLTPPSLTGATTERRAALESARFRALAASVALRPAPPGGPAGPAAGPLAAPAPAASDAPRAMRYATDPAALVEPTVVSTGWVAARAGKIVLLDARGDDDEVARGRIAGAVHAPVAATRETRGGVDDELLTTEAMAAKAGAWGIAADSEVVVYAGDRLQDATQVAVAVMSLGHRKVAVMEGGIGAWVYEGRATTTQAPVPVAVAYRAKAGGFEFGTSLDDVIAASRGGGRRILDVRGRREFEGDPAYARDGHIPGSLWRPYVDDLVSAGGGVYWRAKEQLTGAYEALGLTPDVGVVVTCNSGLRASQTWFTLKVLLGFKDVRWFDGSFAAWSARGDLPIETGPARPAAAKEPR